MKRIKFVLIIAGICLTIACNSQAVSGVESPGDNAETVYTCTPAKEPEKKEPGTNALATKVPGTDVPGGAAVNDEPEEPDEEQTQGAEEPVEPNASDKAEKNGKIISDVVFSKDEIFLDDDPEVALSDRSGKKGVIYYTLDGSEPDTTDNKYTAPIEIPKSVDRSGYPKATVIHAKAYYDDGTESVTAVHTYFALSGSESGFSTYVFMISGDPAELTGRTGILSSSQTIEKGTANYNVRGDASERGVFLEVIDENGEELISQFCGVRVHGGYNRQNDVKSLKLIARKSYASGVGKFKYDFFGTKNSKGKAVDSYDKLVLRSYGNDWEQGYVRDELNERLAEKAGFETFEAVTPAYVYLNGEFYNYVWLHENYCDDYFKEKFKDKDRKGEFVVLEGSDSRKNYDEDGKDKDKTDEFNAIYDKYAYAELTDAKLSELEKEIDVYGYLDYFAFNIYMNNWDWPQNNYKVVKYYKADGEENSSGMYDGRWHFLLHDMDYCFGLYGQARTLASHDNLHWIMTNAQETENGGWWGGKMPTGTNRFAPLFTNMMKREDLRTYFIKKVLEYGETVFSPEVIGDTLSELESEQCDIARYREFLKQKYNKNNSRSSSINAIRDFANQRYDYMVQFMAKDFGMTEAEVRALAR